MSHLVTVDTRIYDLDALEEALEPLSLELVRGQTAFKWFGRWMNDYNGPDSAVRNGLVPNGKCVHAIRVKGAGPLTYEVGLVLDEADPRGGFKLVWDYWAGGRGLMDRISNLPGKTDAGKLMVPDPWRESSRLLPPTYS